MLVDGVGNFLCSFADFILVLSVLARDVLNVAAVVMDLSIFPFSYISLCNTFHSSVICCTHLRLLHFLDGLMILSSCNISFCVW